MSSPVNETLDDRHLSFLELFLGITTSGVGEVYGVADLDIILERDILDLETDNMSTSRRIPAALAYSWVSHLPKSLISWPSFDTSFGRV
jgi:hypothetical protein